MPRAGLRAVDGSRAKHGGDDSQSRPVCAKFQIRGAHPYRVRRDCWGTWSQPCLNTTVLAFENSRSASNPFSRPWPLFLTPPKGSSIPPPAP